MPRARPRDVAGVPARLVFGRVGGGDQRAILRRERVQPRAREDADGERRQPPRSRAGPARRARCRTAASTRLVLRLMPPAPATEDADERRQLSRPAPGLAEIRSVSVATEPRGQAASTFACSRSARQRRSRRAGAPSGADAGAGKNTRAEAATRQPVLVVHRRLVHQVCEALLGVGSTLPIEDDVPRRARSPASRVGGDVDQQPVVCLRAPCRRAPGSRGRRSPGRPGPHAHRPRRHTAWYCAINSRRATATTIRRPPPSSDCPSRPGELRVVDRKGTALRTCHRISARDRAARRDLSNEPATPSPRNPARRAPTRRGRPTASSARPPPLPRPPSSMLGVEGRARRRPAAAARRRSVADGRAAGAQGRSATTRAAPTSTRHGGPRRRKSRETRLIRRTSPC